MEMLSNIDIIVTIERFQRQFVNVQSVVCFLFDIDDDHSPPRRWRGSPKHKTTAISDA